MSYDKLKQQFNTGEFSRAYHFYGEESYLKNHYLKRLSERLVNTGSDFDILTFESGEISGDELMSAVFTPPLMGDAKLIVLKETGIFAQGAAGRGMWKEVFESLPDHVRIIAIEEKFDKRNQAYKAFLEIALPVEFKRRGRGDIKAWVSQILSKSKKTMSLADLEYFLDLAGVDMYHVESQLHKLISLAAKRREITREDIDSMVSATLFTKEYQWTDAMLKMERNKAMGALHELFELRREPVVLLYILSSSFLSAYKASALLKAGKPVTAKSLGVPQEFMAKKYAEIARGGDWEFLTRAVRLIKEADFTLKTGRAEPKTGIITLCAEILSIN